MVLTRTRSRMIDIASAAHLFTGPVAAFGPKRAFSA